ncbi:hypothetical protein PGIGA_G00009660 [Pangasianodon gigas]|uniref:Uncharacterized protein n=1 Tax=Pangasianodon gigas TaxID=30993 RepID=A0ACC5W7N1_PANGG|nr:hypothetical protein [Pangasianodon gigas]
MILHVTVVEDAGMNTAPSNMMEATLQQLLQVSLQQQALLRIAKRWLQPSMDRFLRALPPEERKGNPSSAARRKEGEPAPPGKCWRLWSERWLLWRSAGATDVTFPDPLRRDA